MYANHEDDVFLSPESIIRSAVSVADLRAELDAQADPVDAGWARHALAANGFGDAALMPVD
jgi:hypothetical protein